MDNKINKSDKRKEFRNKKLEKRAIKINKLKKTRYGKLLYFLWYDDSALSWIANVLIAFIFIKYVFYPLLALAFGTGLPVVAVISCSMEHGYTDCGESTMPVNLCGFDGRTGRVNFDSFWKYCGNFYEDRNISKERFKDFELSSGFNKGDIIFLKGANYDNIEIGDVMVFSVSNRMYPIIHRVIEKYDDKKTGILGTKGDHNFAQIKDGPFDEHRITENQIMGKAMFRVPYLGYIKIGFSQLLSIFGVTI